MELNLPHSRTQEEIVRFVSLVETFYCEKIAELIRKERHSEKSLKRQRGLQAQKILEKNDLEKAFLDSVE